MNRLSFSILLMLVSPYLISFVLIQPDSSSTEIGFALGTGSYAEVTRDCNGKVTSVENVPFREGAVSIDHYTPVFHAGIRAGVIGGEPARKIFTLVEIPTYNNGVWSVGQPGSIFYATPIIGLNTEYFGLDVGYMFPIPGNQYSATEGIPAGSLRIGRDDAFHFRARLADDLPLVTGGPGVGNLGLGFGKPRHSIWFGVGASPYDALVWGTRVEFPISDAVILRFAGSLGFGEGTEYGISMGTRVRL